MATVVERFREIPDRLTVGTQLGLAAALLVFLIIAPSVLRAYLVGLLALVMIFSIFAISVNLLAGWAGLVAVGHAGIMAAAGYGIAYISRGGGSYPLQITVGIAIGMLTSLIFGVMAMRTSKVYFLMITIAQGMIVWGLVYRLSSITGGENGIREIRRPPMVAEYWHYYYLCLVAFLLAYALMWVIARSPMGLTLQGMRDSETRIVALGYNPALYKLYGFVLSGVFATTAGVLYVYYHEFISPATADFMRSAHAVLMVILGGVGTLTGPVVGAGIVVWIENVLSGYISRWPTVMGILFILTILFARDGLVGGATRTWRRYVPLPADAAPKGGAAPVLGVDADPTSVRETATSDRVGTSEAAPSGSTDT